MFYVEYCICMSHQSKFAIYINNMDSLRHNLFKVLSLMLQTAALDICTHVQICTCKRSMRTGEHSVLPSVVTCMHYKQPDHFVQGTLAWHPAIFLNIDMQILVATRVGSHLNSIACENTWGALLVQSLASSRALSTVGRCTLWDGNAENSAFKYFFPFSTFKGFIP